MTGILYSVSPIGLGHASRSAAIGMKLRERGLEPLFATGGPAVPFLRSYAFDARDVVREPVPSESDGEMKRVTLWYARYWFDYKSTLKRMETILEEVRPSLVVGDEEFASLSIAVEEGIKNVMISDELELGFARGAIARRAEKKAMKWYEAIQGRVDQILVPDFGVDTKSVRFMTPVVRPLTRSAGQVRREVAVPGGGRMVLFSASGSGIGSFLLRRSLAAFEKLSSSGSDRFVITGLDDPGVPLPDRATSLGVTRDNQDYVAAADLVISTAGKSTIDEARSYGTPIISIPIKNHAEQERNAAALGYSHTDVDRLEDLASKLIGRRTEPANYRGAEKIADYLASRAA